MTVTADSKKRVVLSLIQPGDRFDVQVEGEKVILTKLVLAQRTPNKVRFKKRGGRTVGVIEGAKFDERALKQALAEFP